MKVGMEFYEMFRELQVELGVKIEYNSVRIEKERNFSKKM